MKKSMAYEKIFIEANIFLDYFNNSRPLNYSATKFFQTIATQSNIQIYTSCDIITNVYYFLVKIDKTSALDKIAILNKICKVIEFGNIEISTAISLIQTDKNYFDLEDAIQYILAKKSKCDLIISNDKNFISKDIKVLSSKEYIK